MFDFVLTLFKNFVVQEYEKAVLFQAGRLVGILEPGAYRLWRILKRQRAVKVDLRIRSLTIVGQEMMTSDKVTLRLNLLVKFRVEDPAAAVLKVEGYADQLYADAQLAARSAIEAMEHVLGAPGRTLVVGSAQELLGAFTKKEITG